MSSPIFIDTDVLIDAGLGIQQTVDCLKQHEQQAQLVSKNQRDYRFITELNLLPYP